MKKIKLFCIPYAGGSAMVYFKWKKKLNSIIELHPIELAGRGSRYNEPLYESLDEAVNDIYRYIIAHIDSSPYALFGHSMGSYLAFELFHRLASMNHKAPIHIFFSGKEAPQNNKFKKQIHLLDDFEFKSKIIEFGGTPEELINNKELFHLFLPIIRSDYRIVERYKYLPKPTKIDCGVSVLSGRKDIEISIDDLVGWKTHTIKDFNLHYFDGGHFFIFEDMDRVVKLINGILNKHTAKVSHSLSI